jgi:hypothetical protein
MDDSCRTTEVRGQKSEGSDAGYWTLDAGFSRPRATDARHAIATQSRGFGASSFVWACLSYLFFNEGGPDQAASLLDFRIVIVSHYRNKTTEAALPLRSRGFCYGFR